MSGALLAFPPYIFMANAGTSLLLKEISFHPSVIYVHDIVNFSLIYILLMEFLSDCIVCPMANISVSKLHNDFLRRVKSIKPLTR